jgi:hypothetical protein
VLTGTAITYSVRFILGLFNDALESSEYIASNDRVIGE